MAFAKKDDIPRVDPRVDTKSEVYYIFEINSGGNLNNQMQIGSQSRTRVEMQCTEYIILCRIVERLSPYTTGVLDCFPENVPVNFLGNCLVYFSGNLL